MSSNALNLIVKFTGVDKLSSGIRNMVSSSSAAQRALKGLRDEEKRLRTELREVNDAMRRSGGNLTWIINRQSELESSLAGVNRQMERQRSILARQAQVARISARGQQMQSAGTNNMVTGTAMLSPFVLAGKAAMDFSSGMVDIQQKAGLTNRETQAMAANILRMSKAAHQLPEDMRAGVDTLSGFGLDPRVAVQMIGPIGRLGTAFKVDLSDGAAAAYANLNNLKVPLSDTARSLDVMAAAGNAGAFEVKDMAKWFPSLTAQMQSLGQKGVPAVADLSAALQIARRGTGDADSAANNVQNLLSKLQAPATIRAFQKNFGIDLPAAMRRAYAQGKTPLEAIAELTQKATGGDLSKLGYAFEDMQAQGALRSLIQNLDDYRKIRADAARAGGTVQAAFTQRELQDASTQWKGFTGGLQAFAIIVGTKIMPAANQLLGNVNAMMSGVGNWIQQNPKLASGLINLVGSLTLARIAFGGLQFAFGTILGPLAKGWSLFMRFRELGGVAAAVGRLSTAFAAVRSAALIMAEGVMRAGALMLANPMIAAIVLIGVAIAGAAYLVYTNWDKIKAAFGAGVAWVKSALGALPAWMKSIGSMMMDGLLMALNPVLLANRLLAVARGGITAFKNFFGIKSPSRLMMQMGGHVATGLAMGLDQGRGRPMRSMGRLAAGVAGAGALAIAGPASAATGAGPAPGAAMGNIEIHIHQQPGESADELARRVMKLLERRGGGGNYGDDA